MRYGDFMDYNIMDFSPDEIIKTGSALSDVSLMIIHKLQRFRTMQGRRVGLLFNGLASGEHRSTLHPDGLAVDFFLYESDGPFEVDAVRYDLIECGFRGIIVYFNGLVYSFHADLRPGPRWFGVCTITDGDDGDVFTYYNGFKDPRELVA